MQQHVVDVLAGLSLGGLGGILFFSGLALGLRMALRGRRKVLVLAASATIRLALLLGLTWLAVSQSALSAVCFLLAFAAVRHVATAIARAPLKHLGEA